MEVALDDTKPQSDDYLSDSDLQVTYPLLSCIQTLKEKHHTLSKIHRERYEEVKSAHARCHVEPSYQLILCRTC